MRIPTLVTLIAAVASPAQEREPRFKIETQLARLPADNQGRTGTVRISNRGTKGHVVADALQLLPVEKLPATDRER